MQNNETLNVKGTTNVKQSASCIRDPQGCELSAIEIMGVQNQTPETAPWPAGKGWLGPICGPDQVRRIGRERTNEMRNQPVGL